MWIGRWKLVMLAAVTITAGVMLTVHQPPPRTSKPNQLRSVTTNARKVYPYSVIPGGAMSPAELRTALFTDRVAAAHYSGFHLGQTRVEHLSKAKLAFVSYRVADRVYWTGKRVLLAKGEAILTDGETSARTRCGNRISETPQLPVNPATEPAATVLDTETTEAWQSVAWNAQGDKALANVGSPNNYQSHFGPASVTSMSTTASAGSFGGGGGSMGGGAGGGGGGLAGSNGSSVNRVTTPTSSTPQQGTISASDLPQQPTGPGSIPTATFPGGTVTQPLPGQYVFTPQPTPVAGIPLPFYGPMTSVTLPGQDTTPLSSIPIPDSRPYQLGSGSTSHTSISPTSFLPANSPEGAFIPNQLSVTNGPLGKLTAEAQVPEPHTVVLILSGVALLLLLGVRHRRSLRSL